MSESALYFEDKVIPFYDSDNFSKNKDMFRVPNLINKGLTRLIAGPIRMDGMNSLLYIKLQPLDEDEEKHDNKKSGLFGNLTAKPAGSKEGEGEPVPTSMSVLAKALIEARKAKAAKERAELNKARGLDIEEEPKKEDKEDEKSKSIQGMITEGMLKKIDVMKGEGVSPDRENDSRREGSERKSDSMLSPKEIELVDKATYFDIGDQKKTEIIGVLVPALDSNFYCLEFMKHDYKKNHEISDITYSSFIDGKNRILV